MISQVTKATTGAMTRNTEERLKSINIETMMEPMTRKRRAHHQPDEHGDCQLNLVDVRCEPSHQSLRAEFIDFRMRIPHDMRVELVAYFRTHALGSLRCIALTDQRRAQPDHIEQHKYAAHFEHITLVAIFDANVDHLCHNNGNDELKIASMSLKSGPRKTCF